MNATGKIIVLAYPDTFVTMSTEWVCKILPFFGLGTKEYIKAGHAAMILIEHKTAEAHYFDFGRYITPPGYGRVRGANTDAELTIPFSAKLSETHELHNLNEFLEWLDANPQKTHGEGRLLASVCDDIDFDKAIDFIHSMQTKGSLPYGAFNSNGSNCARFVTDTLISSTTHLRIKKGLLKNKRFTPSTVGNVVKSTHSGEIFEVYDGTIQPYSGSALKENLTNYFDKKSQTTHKKMPLVTIHYKTSIFIQNLSGTGSSAWFELKETELPSQHFNIRRYNELGTLDYDGVYISEIFDKNLPFSFTYDSHCNYCHVIQQNQKIKLEGIGTLAAFNLRRKQRSA